MIKIFQVCDAIDKYLSDCTKNGLIGDYRILLRYNENIYTYILNNTNNQNDQIEDKIYSLYSETEIEFIQDLKDEYHREIFLCKSNITIEAGRRRLNSINNTWKKERIKTPVVTFYSFKGGQGRSTALAAYAAYLSRHKKKKVFIIDFDLEAPGFNNFFLKVPEETIDHIGLIEYLLDKETGLTQPNQLLSYVRQVDSFFSGEGNIYIMPSGNLSVESDTNDFLQTNLNHYIEGLARLDLNNQTYAIELLRGLLQDIENEFHPDVILVDSRTGFNDIMGLFSYSLSHFVVGFFRSDAQSRPGLYHFISQMIKHPEIETFLVNSILPSPGRTNKQLFNWFRETTEEIIDNIISKDLSLSDEDVESRIKIFSLSRRDELSLIGSPEEDAEDFVALSYNGEFQDYERLFSALTSSIISNGYPSKIDDGEDFSNICKEQNFIQYDITDKKIISLHTSKSTSIFDVINRAPSEAKKLSALHWKSMILEKSNEILSALDLYAENVDVEQKYANGQFFLRECMKDLFNLDKYLILGSKGTGKSYIYKALRSENIVAAIKEYASIDEDYIFLDAINVKNNILRVKLLGLGKSPLFKRNFWLLYTWIIIYNSLSRIAPNFKPEVTIKFTRITDNNAIVNYFNDKVKDSNYINLIETEYTRLDKYLLENYSSSKRILTILYDQLDEIVSPEIWSDWIPSLIELWRFKRFDRIFGKLFLRRDLFRKMKGLTNVKDIENQSIDIEWKREEVYSYFFKTILSNDIANIFWGYFYIVSPEQQKMIKDLRHHYNIEINKFRLDNYFLRPLVEIYFGKIVLANRINLGESYFWLYDNLKNADGTISLRPFIDLITSAIKAKEEDTQDKKEDDYSLQSILSPCYYTNKKIRSEAVSRHIDDFVKEIGNTPIEYIFNYFINADQEFKYLKIPRDKFIEAMTKIIKENKDKLSGENTDSLINLMIANGIISKETNSRGDYFRFASLYRYRLGLKGGMSQTLVRRKRHRKTF